MKIGYLTTPYFGKRNTIHPSLNDDELFYVKKHIEYIDTQSLDVDKIYLICTFDNSVNKTEILQKLNDLYNQDERIIIKERENFGASYGSWKFGLHIDNGDCDYMVLAEDDYCLYESDSIKTMLEYFNNDTELFYLCQHWNTNPYQSSYGIIPAHAGLASGVINNKKYHKFRVENNLDFRIIHGNTYSSYYDTQATFLEDYRINNIKIQDWAKEHSMIFAYGELEFGVSAGKKIFAPIITKFFN
jgi:hypothetical protein